jgi:hypothetical protein
LKGRRLAAFLATNISGSGGIPGGCCILPISIICFWTFAALAADAPNFRLVDDVGLTKAAVSLLAVKDFVTFRERLDPALGRISDEKLRQMSDLIGARDPASIETIWSTESHNLQTGDGDSRLVLEYELSGKWIVVDAVVKTEAASKRFTRLLLTPNARPLKEMNAFHLFGKGPAQYLFLSGWIAAIIFTAWAIAIAFSRHAGWHKWTLIALMPLGLTPTLAMNWNTAELWFLEASNNPAGYVIPVFAIRYPMALFSYSETLVPYLYVSMPLIALGYLVWQWRRPRRSQPVLLRTDQENL